MPAVTRELSVVYDTLTFGGASDTLLLDGEVLVTEGPDLAMIAWEFIARESTEALFDTLVASVESTLRTPRKRCRVVLGAATLYDWDPGTGVNTGFNQRPNFTIPGDPKVDSGRSRRYRARVEIDLPADKYAQSGRRTSEVTVRFTPSRRRSLVIAGEYRALTSTDSARARYEASIDAYATDRIAAIGGGVFELADEESVADDTDKVCRFSRTYEEIIANQALGVVDHPQIVRQELRVKVIRDWPGDAVSSRVERPYELRVDYSAWVDKTKTTDLVGLWTTTIRPWITNRAIAASKRGAAAILHEEVEYDLPENRISAQMVLLAVGNGKVLQYTLTGELTEITGEILVPAWTGKPFSKYRYQGPAQRIRRTTEETRVVGVVAATVPSRTTSAVGGAGGYVIMQRVSSAKPVVLGDPRRSGRIMATDFTTVTTEEFYEAIPFQAKRGGSAATTTAAPVLTVADAIRDIEAGRTLPA